MTYRRLYARNLHMVQSLRFHLRILGTRGIPARHGGFETFAEQLAVFLVEKGWSVTVYCQEDNRGKIHEDNWCGIRLVYVPVAIPGPAGTIAFDWQSTLHAMRESGLVLTLGYNTAVFGIFYRLKGIANLINMDGIEWRRKKWGWLAKTWFWMNHWAGCWVSNHLIADNPEIKLHLATTVTDEKITMIPYGSKLVESGDPSVLQRYGLRPRGYATIIARPEPENSILEMVLAWSRKPRRMKLLVLGQYNIANAYQRMVLEAASEEVVFPGAIYDQARLEAIRFHAAFYMHGHQVGGTNPSLVEAMGAGNAILAHDNNYNRWVAGAGALYFRDEKECAELIERLAFDESLVNTLGMSSRDRHSSLFQLDNILAQYEECLAKWACPLEDLTVAGHSVKRYSPIDK